MKRLVVVGGGTGTFAVLSALKEYPVELSAIVSMADDGGSTGLLRDQYGVLPPGDIRRALVALSSSSETLRNLFNYRFENGDFHGQSFGNLFLTALEHVTGSFEVAVQEASRILNIKGEVIPVTLDSIRLHARLKDRTVVHGEHNIDIPQNHGRAAIDWVWLDPPGKANPKAIDAICNADAIIIGPGDLFTSIIPNLLIPGIAESIRDSSALKLYIGNLMTKRGETDGFTGTDFVRVIEQYLGSNILDLALFNEESPEAPVLARYLSEGVDFIRPSGLPKSNKKPEYITAHLLAKGDIVRHDTTRLGEALMTLVKSASIHTQTAGNSSKITL